MQGATWVQKEIVPTQKQFWDSLQAVGLCAILSCQNASQSGSDNGTQAFEGHVTGERGRAIRLPGK